MDSTAHILVVDDDPDLSDMLLEYFVDNGFTVSVAESGHAMREAFQRRKIDLVIMDLRLPGEDGLALTRELRQQGGIPIIMLTGADEPVDRIVGLEVGADDYVGKPVDLRELLARVRTVLRRAAGREAPPGAAAPDSIAMGRCRLDLARHRLYGADGEEVPLTSMEFDLLKAFATHPDRVLSREQLLELAHHRDGEVYDRSIDVRITRIRKKIEADPEKPQILKTIRGAGYMFVREGKSKA
jgi:two-component system phosphate regulon response regulator OmpR